tara:strand:+ start:4705 stop:5280 length:576 start_codon:yes stop_codon:yes gene_type:complete
MLKNKIKEHCEVIKHLEAEDQKLKFVIKKISNKILNGGKLLFCGNGGSAADAQHLAAEFLIRLRPNINRKPIPAISLATDTSTLTACANDYKSSDIFLRTFLALKNKNDVLFVITTSGKSNNIIKVLKEAKKQNIYSFGLLGKGGGKAKTIVDDSIIVKNNNTAIIQESHIFLGHYILENIENLLLKKKYI